MMFLLFICKFCTNKVELSKSDNSTQHFPWRLQTSLSPPDGLFPFRQESVVCVCRRLYAFGAAIRNQIEAKAIFRPTLLQPLILTIITPAPLIPSTTYPIPTFTKRVSDEGEKQRGMNRMCSWQDKQYLLLINTDEKAKKNKKKKTARTTSLIHFWPGPSHQQPPQIWPHNQASRRPRWARRQVYLPFGIHTRC